MHLSLQCSSTTAKYELRVGEGGLVGGKWTAKSLLGTGEFSHILCMLIPGGDLSVLYHQYFLSK